MNNNELEQLREEYKLLIDKRNSALELINMKKQLEDDEKVVQYLKIVNELNNINCYLDEKEILKTAIARAEIKNTLGIYVCMCAYKEYHNTYLRSIFGNRCVTDLGDPHAASKLYVDIEKPYNDGQVLIPIKKCQEFEQNHVVLYPKDMEPMAFYNQVQKEFFEVCISEDQQQAIDKVLKIKNNVFSKERK